MEYKHANEPDRSSLSSRTLYEANFEGSTPWSPRICTVAREKPHCGADGVPFINSTTGFSNMSELCFEDDGCTFDCRVDCSAGFVGEEADL